MQSVGSPQTDQRGRHEPKNKTPEEDVQFVRAHIQSFPTESSHYCRKDKANLSGTCSYFKETVWSGCDRPVSTIVTICFH